MSEQTTNTAKPSTSTTSTSTPRSTPTLLTDALAHVSSLMRKEVDLARSEISQNANKAVAALGMIVAAVVIALVALNILAAAVAAGLAELGIPAGWAALIVGVVLAVIAFALSAKGVNDLKLTSLAPTRTTENVKRDASVVKDTTNAK